jgi:xylulokinase
LNRLLIGLDIGTSSVKAGVYDLSGRERAVYISPIVTRSPQAGWSEQDPNEWWTAVKQVLKQCTNQVAVDELAAIGLSGQCPGHVLVDDAGVATGTAIIWRDQRAHEEAQWINEHITQDQAIQWTGREIIVDATQPPARILWLMKHRSEDWKRKRWLLQPKDFIGLKLTERCATDFHTAYSLTDPTGRGYSKGLLEFLDLDITCLPELLSPEQVLGFMDEGIAREFGLSGKTPVITGTIDAYCDNLAGGVIHPGNAVDVAGTSEIISLATSAAREGKGVFLGKLGDHAFLCGPTQAGGETLHWMVKTFYSELDGKMDHAAMENEAANAPVGSSRLIFLPYLQGERAPIWDSNARGVFMGLTLAHDRHHVTRAVYEGVGFAVRHVLETCEDVGGAKAGRLMICGGGSRSEFWNQVKADITQKEVVPIQATASACLGAAMLAAAGSGVFGNIEEAYDGMSQQGKCIQPDPSKAGIYDENYGVYRQIYPSLKSLFSRQEKELANE